MARTLIGCKSVLYESIKHVSYSCQNKKLMCGEFNRFFYHKTSKGALTVLCSVVKNLGSD